MNTASYTFRVVIRDVGHMPGHTTADVVRNDGKVVRSGLYHRSAHIECELLNRSQAEGWTAAKFFQQRELAHAPA